METFSWQQAIVDLLQAVISGIFVGLAIFYLDEMRAKRERRLSDFRIAANWARTEHRSSLRYFDLTKANLSGSKFLSADLESTVFTGGTFWGTDFSNTNLRGANFRKAQLVGTIFRDEATIIHGDFTKAVIIRYKRDDIERPPDFRGANLYKALFRHARIEWALFNNSNLQGADFTGAVVRECDFTIANLKGSKWQKARCVENCIWKDVVIDATTGLPEDLRAEIQRQNAKGELVESETDSHGKP